MNKNMNPLQILQIVDVALVFGLLGFGYAIVTTLS
jgi:phosphate/sulfate permease